MNALAHVIHALVTGKEVTHLPDLPLPEQVVLADLQPLLRRPPQHLAALLAQAESPEPWWAPAASSVCDRISS